VRCLKKDRRQRLQAIGEARVRIEESISGTSEEVAASRATAAIPSRGAHTGLIAALAVVAAAAALVTWAATRPEPPALLQLSRFEIVPPPAQSLNPGSDRDIAISPDGRHIVYRSGGGQRLEWEWLAVGRARDRSRQCPDAVRHHQRAPAVFFPRTASGIGFFDGASLKKVSIAGWRPAITICETPAISRGAKLER
jgi:hypothetical protein